VQVRFIMRGRSDAGAASLVLRIESDRVRAGLELPAAQARAARARLADPARALELATALEVLPEQFTMGVSTGAPAGETPLASADDLRRLLQRLEASAPRGQGGGANASAKAWVGWTVPRGVALEHAAMLDELLEDTIVALAQLFVLLADPSEGEERPRGKGPRFSGRRTGDSKSGRKKDGRDRDGRDGEVEARGRGREREVEAEGEDTEPEPARDAPAVAARRADDKPLLRAPTRRRPLRAAEVVIEKGAKVRVLKGPFSGKVGVVHELDTKGGARVMLGLLAVRLEVTNLMPCVEDRGRPVLSSSHRKPIPARS
jgi:hypothetical protein